MSRRWSQSRCIEAEAVSVSVALLLSVSVPGFASTTAKPASSAKSAAKITAPKAQGKVPPKKVTRPLPPLLQEVQEKYAKSDTLNAEFEQVNESAALQQKKKSSGLIMLKHPNKLRWETLKPDRNLLVSDGHTFWFYTPPFDSGEHGQVMERKTSQVQSRLANALLAGNFSVVSDMKIVEVSPSEFTLTPKPKSAGTVTLARIKLDPEKKLIQEVSLDHSDGNHTEISLKNIKLGEDLPDALFAFTPPPGTDRVEQ